RANIMVGAGLDASNVLEVARCSGAREFHGSAKAMRKSPGRHYAALPGLEADWWQTDADIVRAMVNALKVT
ncbi:MAG: copper homeostasis protein CutC, partial [Gemmatimonadota bacterium]|nr:copper homeostasis protein CutC [Gemmatimonadota bacterium]